MAAGRALRQSHSKRYFVASRLESAAETIGALNDGDHVTGLTCGQFSMIDILEHMCREAGGECEVFVSTWTAGIYDVERSKQLMDTGLIKSIRFVLDRAMFSKSPQYAGPMIEAFGIDAFRDTNVHAKVTMVSSPRKRMVCRASMNLNKNLKTEQFDISVCDQMHAFFSDWAEGIWSEAHRGTDAQSVFKAVWDKFRQTRGEPVQYLWPRAADVAKTLPKFAMKNGTA